jgi:hypothetical protein
VIPEVFDYCPFLCGKCVTPTTASNTTAAVTTAPATAAPITTASATLSTAATNQITTASATTGQVTTGAQTTIAGTTTAQTTAPQTTKTQTTVSVTTGKPCTIACSYGMTLDPVTCLCSCLPGFSQPTCSTFNCSSSILDAAECALGKINLITFSFFEKCIWIDFITTCN